MEATIESRLVVLENQIETIERELNSKKPDMPIVIILGLLTELNGFLHAKIHLLEEKNRLKDKEPSSIH